jgi:hypothetical protein
MRMVCVRNFKEPKNAVTMMLIEAIPEFAITPVSSPEGHAWWVMTRDGRLCGFKAGGTAPVVNGLRMNYFCPDDTALIGFPTPGKVWTARQVRAIQTRDLTATETVVELRVVWR